MKRWWNILWVLCNRLKICQFVNVKIIVNRFIWINFIKNCNQLNCTKHGACTVALYSDLFTVYSTQKSNVNTPPPEMFLYLPYLKWLPNVHFEWHDTPPSDTKLKLINFYRPLVDQQYKVSGWCNDEVLSTRWALSIGTGFMRVHKPLFRDILSILFRSNHIDNIWFDS